MKRFILAALLLAGCSPGSEPQTREQSDAHTPEKLAVLTALPLFWGEAGPAAVIQGQDGAAPLIADLASHWALSPLDMAKAGQLQSLSVLLIAQPHALAPQELVALDDWVRGGGLALILADPDLRWPSSYPIGDPRRAPLETRLTPLLNHWGLALKEGKADSGPIVRDLSIRLGDINLTLSGAGTWVVRSSTCTLTSSAIAQCRIGRGQVTVLADADILNVDADDPHRLAKIKFINRLFRQAFPPSRPVSQPVRPERLHQKMAESP